MKFVPKTKNTYGDEHIHPAKGGIRQKLLRNFVILGLVPIIALSIAGTIFLVISRQESIEETENLLLKQKAEEVSRFIDETIDAFEVQVGYEFIVPPSSGYPLSETGIAALYDFRLDAQLFLLQSLLSTNRNLVEAAFINTLRTEETDTIPKKQLPPPGKETRVLTRQQFENPDFNYNLLDCGLGHEVLSAGDCEYYAFYPSSELFKQIAAGKNYIGRPYKTLEGYFITLGAPVKNSNGKVIGGIRGELSLKPLERIFAQATLGTRGYAYLIDDSGFLIAATAGKNLPKDTTIKNTLTEKLDKSVGVVSAGVSRNIFGDTVIASAIPVGRLNLAIITEWPYSDAYSVVYSLVNQAAVFILIILAATVILSRVLARQITRPVNILQFAASKIGKGDFEQISEIKTGDELEFLAHSLNKMAQSLKEIEELRKQALQAQLLEASLAREKELVEIKDSFLDTASHQLRTPVSAIRWQLELLQSEKISDTAKELVQGAYEHVEFLSEISSDLINAASYGAGYQVKNFTDVSLTKVIDEVLTQFSSQVEQAKLKISNIPAEKDVSVSGSYPALRVLFENIIRNAIRYTKSEGQVTITTINQADSVEVRVADTGIGIPAEEHKMLFRQFFRATNAIETRNVGTGLGLYIAKNIVDGHKGNIWFISERDKGTTLFISIPVKRQ